MTTGDCSPTNGLVSRSEREFNSIGLYVIYFKKSFGDYELR